MTKAVFSPMPPKEALKFFRSKGYAFSFDWRDVWKEEHAIAFTVAKAQNLDILQTIRTEVDRAIEKGLTFESFKKNLKPLLVQKGWWGRAVQRDQVTGEEKEVQLGSTRRLKTIWRTNSDMAYAAGNWQHIEDTKKTHPYLKYRCAMLENSREQHKAWNNLVLPVDDPFWDNHYPPNGWNCKCWVQQVPKNWVTSGKVQVSQRPKEEYEMYRNKRTGEISLVPKGVTPGFDYNVGKARTRAFTPPPLGGLPETFKANPQALPAIPQPSPLPKNAVLPDSLSDEGYIKEFLGIFGADIAKPAYFEDKIGDMMPINEDLFLNRQTGQFKANKNGRGKYLKLLALSLLDPDEIWMQWVKNKSGQWSLKKRYIKIWQEPHGSHSFTVFDWQKDGWRGTTTFPVQDNKGIEERDEYLNQFRNGLLLYTKSPK